ATRQADSCRCLPPAAARAPPAASACGSASPPPPAAAAASCQKDEKGASKAFSPSVSQCVRCSWILAEGWDEEECAAMLNHLRSRRIDGLHVEHSRFTRDRP